MTSPVRWLISLWVVSTVSIIAEESPPPWAYGFKEPPPRDAPQATPGKAGPPPTDPVHYQLPFTDRSFTRAEITDIFGPADFYPNDHPAPPFIVAHGKSPNVWACARCHYANGKGRPENAGLAGLPADYFVAQIRAFRDGARASSDPRKANVPMMVEYAKDMTDEEVQAAAAYYSSMPWTPWIRVVETERAPRTTISAGMYLQIPDGGDEALGQRIIEVPENALTAEIQRDPRAGFIAYVPIGSVRAGERLVVSGGDRTVACATCHGAQLEGGFVQDVCTTPGLAGRSPSYLMRQLFDLRSGRRHGAHADLMKPVVANLSTDDMLAIAAYLASLTPVTAALR